MLAKHGRQIASFGRPAPQAGSAPWVAAILAIEPAFRID
jgi:hypothetical protein